MVSTMDARHVRFGAFVLSGLFFFFSLHLGLLVPIYAGLLVFVLVNRLSEALLHIHSSYPDSLRESRWWTIVRPTSTSARLLAVSAVAGVVLTVLVAIGLGLHLLLRNGAEVHDLLLTMSEIVASARTWIPQAIAAALPDNVDLLATAGQWLRAHAADVGTAGLGALRVVGYILLGLLLGAMISIGEAAQQGPTGPVAQRINEQLSALCDAFWRVVSAQFWISAVNTTVTAIYLLVILPAFDVHLPFAKTLVAVTFVVGLLPVVGNLISNSAITIISFAQSWQVAAASLSYLIVIHKLEYFLNARIIGNRINARAYEILLSMILMEHLFGAAGVVAAPVFYAWLKAEWLRWDRVTPPVIITPVRLESSNPQADNGSSVAEIYRKP
jgi:predicted PurR-regulated permease PerM